MDQIPPAFVESFQNVRNTPISAFTDLYVLMGKEEGLPGYNGGGRRQRKTRKSRSSNRLHARNRIPARKHSRRHLSVKKK